MFDFAHTIFVKVVAGLISVLMFLGLAGEKNEVKVELTQETVETPTEELSQSLLGGVWDKLITMRSATHTDTSLTQTSASTSTFQKNIEIKKTEKETLEQGPYDSSGKTSAPTAENSESKERDTLGLRSPQLSPVPPPVSSGTTTPLVITKGISPTKLNEKVRDATVNIFCLSKYGSFFEPLSGSGVIIDPRGVILTNAHVAQYFLLENYNGASFIDCVVRSGSPARTMYRASPLFIPTKWIEDNRETIIQTRPRSSGENDYALLLITESALWGVNLPDSFPFIPLTSDDKKIRKDVSVFVAGYAAGFLGGISTNSNLWLTTTISTIKNLYTFEDYPTNTVDLFEIYGTASAQEGVSGGPVVGFEDGEVLGIATTRTAGDTTNERTLRILSATYIKKSLKKHTGTSFEEFLSGDLRAQREQFASTTAPQLTKILYEVLDK